MENIQHKQLPPIVYNLKGWIELVDEIKLKDIFDALLNQSDFKILNYTSHQFPVNGFTAFWLLAESHLALHTFTENGYTYIELSSCNQGKAKNFKKLTEELKFDVNWDEEIASSEPILIKTI
ncbi:S-adenosylmethionine decarboxylase [Plebeiibacterium sediminum]|uniref:S-adenosylmethionine decarboxylase n=1 Tax=Plebeiibacterium sediminum TaxID=2992112 RepID=A0AAE3SGP8_9BACT|nr:S-adenosylmethionine decarboxylase [Plebeiobacterium sediminum]MCW3787518.1 S-adenosylmethionine decarboxylase [Plebeiobacterium sediminum]